MIATRVQNGTNAGWRIVRPQRPAEWTCECGHDNKYAARCVSCLRRRT